MFKCKTHSNFEGLKIGKKRVSCIWENTVIYKRSCQIIIIIRVTIFNSLKFLRIYEPYEPFQIWNFLMDNLSCLLVSINSFTILENWQKPSNRWNEWSSLNWRWRINLHIFHLCLGSLEKFRAQGSKWFDPLSVNTKCNLHKIWWGMWNKEHFLGLFRELQASYWRLQTAN